MIDLLLNFLNSLPLWQLTSAFILFIIFSVVLFYFFKIINYFLKKLSSKTQTELDDLIIKELEFPFILLIIFTSIFLSIEISFPKLSFGKITTFSIYVASLILVAAISIERILKTLINFYKEKIAPKTETRLDDEFLPLIEKILRFVLYVLTFLMILSNLGIDITPILAGVGIASVAVALALQDSLSNFFAGVNIAADRPIKKDDFIRTDFGIEGIVQEVGWRSTKILTLQNNVVVVPNNKLAQSVITNFYRPDEKVVTSTTFLISFDENPEKVIDVVIKSLKKLAAARSDVFDPTFEPIVRFENYAEFGMNFKALVRVNNYKLNFIGIDLVNREIYKTLKENNIKLAYPTRIIIFYDTKKDANDKNTKINKK